MSDARLFGDVTDDTASDASERGDADGVVADGGTEDGRTDGETPGEAVDDEVFERELETARELLADADDVSALHVGVVREGRVDTTAAQRPDGDRDERLQALTLLASHLRLVAAQADAEYDAVAANAAQIAGRFEAGEATPTPDEVE